MVSRQSTLITLESFYQIFKFDSWEPYLPLAGNRKLKLKKKKETVITHFVKSVKVLIKSLSMGIQIPVSGIRFENKKNKWTTLQITSIQHGSTTVTGKCRRIKKVRLNKLKRRQHTVHMKQQVVESNEATTTAQGNTTRT